MAVCTGHPSTGEVEAGGWIPGQLASLPKSGGFRSVRDHLKTSLLVETTEED